MPTYTIHNKVSGQCLGTYEAPTKLAAIMAMRHDAGYPSEQAVIEALGNDMQDLYDELEVTEL